MRELLEAEVAKLLYIRDIKKVCKLRVAIYARKSREDLLQVSIETQIEACREFVSKHEYLFSLKDEDIYSEDNVSGMYIENRLELSRLMAKVKEKTVDVVICSKVDRLSRDALNTDILLKQLEESDAYFIGGDDLGDNSAAGVLIKQIQRSINEFQVRRSIEDMIAGKIKNTKDGYSCGGPGNFGYSVVNRRYVINPYEAVAVSTIFDLFIKGKSYNDIIDELEVLGFKTRTGKNFSKATINAILTNERNSGVNIWNSQRKRKKRKRISKLIFDEVVNDSGIVEGIVTKEKFDEVQRRLQSKAVPRDKAAKHKPYLLTGLIKCAHCGGNMTGNSTKGGRDHRLRRIYECHNHKHKGTDKCMNTSINADFIEKHVVSTVINLVKQRIASGKVDFTEIRRSIENDTKQAKTLRKQIQNEHLMIDKLAMGLVNSQSEMVTKSINIKVKQSEDFIMKAEARANKLESRINRYSSSELEKQALAIIQDGHCDITRPLIETLINCIQVSTENITFEF